MVLPPDKSANKYAELTALFQAGIAGDAASYGQFLQAISAILRRTVCKKLPVDSAEDLLQEILISVHKARHTYDGQRPLMPWLLAIAQFRLNDHLRRLYVAAGREMVDIAPLAETLADVTEAPADNEYIDELLKNMPAREQRILTMMYADGYTAKETGSRLGMNESAVKVAAHRAMKKLREKF